MSKKITQALEKKDKPARISVVKDVTERATVDAVLKKNRYADNLATIRDEAANRTAYTTVNSTVKDYQLPDIECITRSLLKIQEITAAAHSLWPNKKTARKIITDSVEIINQACKKKFAFGNGKNFRCIVGGLFYLLGFRYNDPKKQREIAITLQITDVSIRLSYKRWLKEFPDLFQDVTANLADQEFRHHCYPNAHIQSQTTQMNNWKSVDKRSK